MPWTSTEICATAGVKFELQKVKYSISETMYQTQARITSFISNHTEMAKHHLIGKVYTL